MTAFIKSIQNRFFNGGFLANVLLLVGGTACSQLVLLLTSPIITRLYSPDDFGAWSILRSLSLVFATLASLRYELSIVIPESDREAANLLAGSVFISFVMTGLVTLLTCVMGRDLAMWMSADILIPWLWIVPVTLFLTGVYQTGNYWMTRSNQFGYLTAARIIQSSVMVSVQIGVAVFLGVSASGLILGAVIGQFSSSLFLAILIYWKNGKYLIQSFSWPTLSNGLLKYCNFPIYVAPYSFAGVLQQQLQILLLARYAAPQIVGFYGMAYTIVRLPVSLIASALNQAFFPKAAQGLRDGNLEKFVGQILNALAILTTPIFCFFVFNSEALFRLAFGEEWKDAGRFGALLAAPAFMLLYTSWLDRIYDVLGKQRLALVLELAYDFISIVLSGIVIVLFRDPIAFVAIYSFTCCVYNFIWLLVTFRVSNLPSHLIFQSAKKIVIIFGSFYGLHFLSANLSTVDRNNMLFDALILAFYYLFWAVKLDLLKSFKFR